MTSPVLFIRAIGLTLVATASLILVAPAQAEPDLLVQLDQATLLRAPSNVATFVIGNPLIADVSAQAGGMLIVTGKGYGATNLLALDRNGGVLMDRTIHVGGPRDNVIVVHRGVERETFSCAPLCEHRLTLGDNKAYFESTLSQSDNRNAKATNKEGKDK